MSGGFGPKRAAKAIALTSAASAALVFAGTLGAQTGAKGPVATYWATATTTSGLGAAPGDPMAMLNGGGGAQRLLQLQLESGRIPADTPNAEHVPPAGLKVGPRLPLLSPRGPDGSRTERSGMGDGGEAKGRMLIYWGCGDTVRPGQPLIVDFAKMGKGGGSGLPDAGIRTPRSPSAGAGRTYGEWPNEKARVRVPATGSLIGNHLVRGNYTPDIRFSLAAGQDFMGALRLTGVSDHQRGAVPLGWQPVREAKAYFAHMMGSAKGDDLIVWSSSEIAITPGSVPEHLAPGEIEALLRRKVILPAQSSRCTIPAAVADAAPDAMVRMTAFGGEVNFSYPPRPANPRTPWTLDHVVKLRYASTASTILGMPDLSDDAAEADPGAEAGAVPGVGGLLRKLSPLGGRIKLKSPFGKRGKDKSAAEPR